MEIQNIQEETYKGDPVFKGDLVVGVRAEGLKDNVLVGSYVIIPKSVKSSPFDLSNEEWADIKTMMNKIKTHIDTKYKPDGYNLGWNVGKAAGQTVSYCHFHVIPRFNDEPFAGKGVRYWLKKDENIRPYLK